MLPPQQWAQLSSGSWLEQAMSSTGKPWLLFTDTPLAAPRHLHPLQLQKQAQMKCTQILLQDFSGPNGEQGLPSPSLSDNNRLCFYTQHLYSGSGHTLMARGFCSTRQRFCMGLAEEEFISSTAALTALCFALVAG